MQSEANYKRENRSYERPPKVIEVQRPKSKQREIYSTKPQTPAPAQLELDTQPSLEKLPEEKQAPAEEKSHVLVSPAAAEEQRKVFEPDFEEILPSEQPPEKNPSLERYIKQHRVKTEASKDDLGSKASNLDSDEGSLGPYGHIKPNIRLQIEIKPPHQHHSRSYLTDIPEVGLNELIAVDQQHSSRAERRLKAEHSPQEHESSGLLKHAVHRDRPSSKYLEHSTDSRPDRRPISSVRSKGGPLPKTEYRKLLEQSEHHKQVYRHVFRDASAHADLSQVLRSQDKRLVSHSPPQKKPNVRGAIGEKYTKLPVILLNEKKGTRLLRAAPKSFVSNYHEAQVKNRLAAPAFSPAPRYQFHKPDWWG